MRKELAKVVLLPMFLISLCVAQTPREQKDHVMLSPSQIRWLPLGGGYPPGAQVALLDGNPLQAGAPYTIALKLPDGYRVQPHWHPAEIQFSVVQGTAGMGVGEKFDMTRGQELQAGSFMKLGKEVRHYEWAKGETIVHLHGLGPTSITYVNPDDDPRQKAKQE